MSQYEYMVIQLLAGARITHLNERLANHVADGWEPIMMSGDANLNVMLRRAVQPAGAKQAQARAQAAVAAQPARQPVAPT